MRHMEKAKAAASVWRHVTCCTRWGQRPRCPVGPQNAGLAGTSPHTRVPHPHKPPGAGPGQADEDATSPRRWQVGGHVSAGTLASAPRWPRSAAFVGTACSRRCPMILHSAPPAPSPPRGAGDGVTVPPTAARRLRARPHVAPTAPQGVVLFFPRGGLTDLQSNQVAAMPPRDVRDVHFPRRRRAGGGWASAGWQTRVVHATGCSDAPLVTRARGGLNHQGRG